MFSKSFFLLLALALACFVAAAPIDSIDPATGKRCNGQCYPGRRDVESAKATTDDTLSLDARQDDTGSGVGTEPTPKKRCVYQCSSSKRDEEAAPEPEIIPTPPPLPARRCLGQCSSGKRDHGEAPASEVQLHETVSEKKRCNGQCYPGKREEEATPTVQAEEDGVIAKPTFVGPIPSKRCLGQCSPMKREVEEA